MSSLQLAEILQCSHHAGGVGIVGIYNQPVPTSIYQLRAVILRYIICQSLTNLCRTNSEISSDSCCCQRIIQIIRTDQVSLYGMCLAGSRPVEGQERRTACQPSAHKQPWSLAITYARQSLSNTIQVRILMMQEMTEPAFRANNRTVLLWYGLLPRMSRNLPGALSLH